MWQITRIFYAVYVSDGAVKPRRQMSSNTEKVMTVTVARG